jgi:hypothetical protein
MMLFMLRLFCSFLLLLFVVGTTTVAAATSCPSSMGLVELNPPKPTQTATFLDIDVTCIYQQFAENGTFSYQFVPSPFIRVEPGEMIAFYSNPPNIYDIVERVSDDDSTTTIISLAHNVATKEPVNGTSFVITWPADQLEYVRMGSVNATLLLAEGFTNLREVNVTAEFGGLQATLSPRSDGQPIYLQVRGRNRFGTTVEALNGTQQLIVDIETGENDISVIAPPSTITGLVHSVRNINRVGNVYLNGVQAVERTGLGPGQLFANDCSNVVGECEPLKSTLSPPDTECRATDTCLVTAFTTWDPRICAGQFPGEGNTCERGGNGGSGCGISNFSVFIPVFVVAAQLFLFMAA